MNWRFAIVVLLLPATVRAESSLNPNLARVLSAPAHLNAVFGAAGRSTTWIRHGCQSTTYSKPKLTYVWQAPRFDLAGDPIAGEWGERLTAEGCGLKRTINVRTVVEGPNVLRTGVLAPGLTHADLTLQLEVSREVFQSALAKAPGCRDAFVDDTRYEGRAGSSSKETWTVIACGKTLSIAVELIPDATGFAVVAHLPAG